MADSRETSDDRFTVSRSNLFYSTGYHDYTHWRRSRPQCEVRSCVQPFLVLTAYGNLRIHYKKSEVASPFCIVAKLVSQFACAAGEIAMLRIDRLLVENGCDISKTMTESSGDPRFVGLFQRNPSFLLGRVFLVFTL